MLAILRRRWFMVALSIAAFLIAIDYLSTGLQGIAVEGPLIVSSLGVALGWIVLTSSVLIARSRLRVHETDGFVLDYRRDRRLTSTTAVGVGLIALGTSVDSTSVLALQFARYVVPGCYAAGYALIAVAALVLAKAMSHEEQLGRSNRRIHGRHLLVTGGVGIAVGVLPYLFETVPGVFGDIPHVALFEIQAASTAVIGVALLASAMRKLGSPGPLAAVGLGFLAIALGRAIEGVWSYVLTGFGLVRVCLVLIGLGYVAIGVGAGIVAARTKSRSAPRLPDDSHQPAEVEGLWAR
ncbi:MAG: hypothetical protein ABSC30_16255 [Acidimicrobiales bacterium]